MLRRRYVKLDCSAGSASGTISAPIGRLAAVYYDFSDGSMTGNLSVTSLGASAYSKTGADDNDGVQMITDPPIIADETVIALASISGASPGDTCNVSLFIED
jgi:hypothetical protein